MLKRFSSFRFSLGFLSLQPVVQRKKAMISVLIINLRKRTHQTNKLSNGKSGACNLKHFCIRNAMFSSTQTDTTLEMCFWRTKQFDTILHVEKPFCIQHNWGSNFERQSFLCRSQFFFAHLVCLLFYYSNYFVRQPESIALLVYSSVTCLTRIKLITLLLIQFILNILQCSVCCVWETLLVRYCGIVWIVFQSF